MLKAIIAFIIGIFILAFCIKQCNGSDVDYMYEQENSDTPYSHDKESKPQEEGDTQIESPATSTVDYSQYLSRLEIPQIKESMPSQLLIREGYSLSYNNSTKCANWVAWYLTREHTDGEWSRKGQRYQEDTEADYPRQECEDWKYNPDSYDHGHMCPAADNKWSAKAMEQSFLLTNMCPQDHNLNGGDWNDLEKYCQRWAFNYGEIYITCGPIFYHGKSKVMGGDKEIWVPDAFFKVVLCMKDSPKAIGFIYPNEGEHHYTSHYACSVDEVESKTGIDFFFNLPDNIEDSIESVCDFSAWE